MTSTERGRGGWNICHISVSSVLKKQPGIQCYENIVFHLAHTPDDAFSRSLLLCLISSSFVIWTQASVRRVVHSPAHPPCTHRAPAKGRPLGEELQGTRGWVKGQPCPLRCCCLVPAHNQRRGGGKGVPDSLGGAGHITLQDSLMFPGLLSIGLLCPRPTATCSENKTFWTCQLTEPCI